MKKRTFFVLSVLVVLVLSTVTVAQAFGAFGLRGTGPRVLTKDDLTRPYDQLALTDEERAELQKFWQERFEKDQMLREESRKLFFELKQMALEQEPDDELLERKLDRFNELRQLLFKQANETRERIRGLLTEEQLRKMESYRSDCRRRRGIGFRNRLR